MSPRVLLLVAIAAVGLVLVLLVVTLLGDVNEPAEVHTEEPLEVPELDPATTAPTTTSTTVEPATTTTIERARSAPTAISSTAYCEQGRMADGHLVHDGAVSSHVLPRGSSWLVVDGPAAGRTFTVEDTGPGATFDIWMTSCPDAIVYGRRTVHLQAVG